LISVRICTRSLASRLDSGSSNRNTCGSRTDGAADGDPLTLPAGELAGIAVGERAQSRDVGSLIDARIDGGLIGFAQLQLKAMLSRTLICG
jgi:hypothetical protein